MSITEVLLMVGVIFKSKNSKLVVNRNAILKNLLLATTQNIFGASSTDNAIDCLNRDVFFNDLDAKSVNNAITSDFKTKQAIVTISKILTPLILLENDIEDTELRYCKLFGDKIFADFGQQKDYYKNNIFNYVIFYNNSKYDKINRNKMQVEDLREDYFNKHCPDQSLVDKYIELAKKVFNSSDIDRDDLEDVYYARKDIIVEYILKGNK